MSNIKRYNKKPRDKNCKQHGEWVDYYENGNLFYRCNYIHGISHGLNEVYYEDGRLKYRGYWDMDKQVGYWYWYGEEKYYLCLI